MRGLPDWGRFEVRDGIARFAAYELDRVQIGLPDRLSLARDPSGRPGLHLLAVRPVIPMPGRRGHGRLDLELQLDSSLKSDDGAIRCAPPLRAWVWLRSAMLALPAPLSAPTEADCSGLGFVRLSLPLEAADVTLVESALVEGTLPIIARVECEVAGVAPRLDASAEVDLARLRAALAVGAMSPARLAQILAEAPASLGVKVRAAEGLAAPDLAQAIADHIRGRLCAAPLAATADSGLTLVLAESVSARGTARLDLSQPVIATRVIAAALDPFAAARALAEEVGGIQTCVTRGQAGLLPTGAHQLVVDTNLAQACIGPLLLGATIAVAARPPARTHAVVEDFELPANRESVVRQIHLAPGEPLEWTLTGFACWPTVDGRGAERLSGPAVRATGSRALLRPDAFPLIFVAAEASVALLALAEVRLTLSGERPDGAPATAGATLTTACPRLTLALPADASAIRFEGELIGREDSSRIPLPAHGAGAWRLELSDVPGYGPRAVEIHVVLPEETSLAAIEVRAEDDAPETPPQTYAFTPTVTTRTHRWLCRDPFRPGLLWRWRGRSDYSAPVHTARLDIRQEAQS